MKPYMLEKGDYIDAFIYCEPVYRFNKSYMYFNQTKTNTVSKVNDSNTVQIWMQQRLLYHKRHIK